MLEYGIIGMPMTKIIFDLDNNLEKRFRETVAKRKGLHKGVIKESLEEAVEQWIERPLGEKIE
jgi:hypothetical protein